MRGTRTAWGFGGRQESPERARSHESGWLWSRKRSLEPRQRSLRSECRGTAKSSGGVGQGRQPEKAHVSSAFFQIAARLDPCQHQGRRKKRRRREHRFPPPAELGRLGVGQLPEAALCLHRVNVVLPLQGCAYRYMYFRTIVLTTCEIADQVRNDGESLKAFKSVKAR